MSVRCQNNFGAGVGVLGGFKVSLRGSRSVLGHFKGVHKPFMMFQGVSRGMRSVPGAFCRISEGMLG